VQHRCSATFTRKTGWTINKRTRAKTSISTWTITFNCATWRASFVLFGCWRLLGRNVHRRWCIETCAVSLDCSSCGHETSSHSPWWHVALSQSWTQLKKHQINHFQLSSRLWRKKPGFQVASNNKLFKFNGLKYLPVYCSYSQDFSTAHNTFCFFAISASVWETKLFLSQQYRTKKASATILYTIVAKHFLFLGKPWEWRVKIPNGFTSKQHKFF